MAKFSGSPVRFPAQPPVQPWPGDENMNARFGEAVDQSKWGPWGCHDPAIFKDPVTGKYYTYGSGSDIRRSDDLLTWQVIGTAITELPADSAAFCGSDTPVSLAPDMIKVGSEYRLYSAAGTPPYGSHRSSLYLMVSDSPEGPFVPRGAVVNSTNDDHLNAIDACPIIEEGTGEHYLFYGSFWGGIFVLRLNPRNGLAYETGFGKLVATRPKWCDRAIEGPYCIYNPDTGYYYLFVSYGSLKSDYNIRVGRSKHILGPYLDYNGRDLTDVDDPDARVGTMVAAGYKFDDHQGWMGPGHNSVLRDDDGSWYIFHHIRPYNFEKIDVFRQHVRKIVWSADGWPLVSPEPYAGEDTEQDVPTRDLVGHYEYIKLTPMIPQGVLQSVSLDILTPEMPGVSSTRNNWALRIPAEAEGRVELGGSMRGWWKRADARTLEIHYAGCVERFRVIPAWDEELGEPTLALTGIDSKGVCVWCKKRDLPAADRR